MSIEFKAILGMTVPYVKISESVFQIREAKPMFAISETSDLPASKDKRGREVLSSLIADDITHYESLGVLSDGCASSHVDYHVGDEDGLHAGKLIRLKLFRVRAYSMREGIMSYFRPREEIEFTLGVARHYVKGNKLVFTGCFIPPVKSMCMKGLSTWYGEKRKSALTPVKEEKECRGFYDWTVTGFDPEDSKEEIKIIDGVSNDSDIMEIKVLV